MSESADHATLMLLIAVLLPPRALDELGLLVEERAVRTPFGPVGPLALRRAVNDFSLWVQPYSGLPTRTDPRATLYAARALGVRRVLSWDLGIGVNHVLARGQTVIATDAIDWTRHQPDTFYASADFQALIGSAGEPSETATFCPESTAILHAEYPAAPPALVVGMDGPRRETPAEARMTRLWGADVLSNNLTPEAMLARELGLCFSALVTVGDYSRDQRRAPVEGELRHGLEQTMTRLPSVLRRLSQSPGCLCADI